VKLKIYNEISVESGETLDVSDVAFGADFNEALIHQVVTAYQAGARAGTSVKKNRAAVSGGGSKPWRQKGTGRARAGTIRSPIWRGGGNTFAGSSRDYSQKVNRKMYRGAMRSIFSELARQDRLIVVSDFSVPEAKTKKLLEIIKPLEFNQLLVISETEDINLYLSARNLRSVDICSVDEIDPVSLVGNDKVLITIEALKKVEEWLQ